MEAFKILGTIAIDNSQAGKALAEIGNKAANTATAMGSAFANMANGAENVGKSLADVAKESGKTMNQLRSEVAKAAAAYRQQGFDASTAMKKAYADIGVQAEKAHEKINDETEETGASYEKLGDKVSGIGAKIASIGIGIGKALAAGVGVAAAAVGALTKSAVESYAEYEQLVGGVETLFEDLSWDVAQYANNAFQTAGLSANEYMSTVMGFAASLNQSLVASDGNIARAADMANMAITDMADNANKMGTSMESIQNAYQGFAKQNYTMLDNLKLGYGGTKEEMQRLLAEAEKLSGMKFDISNFADITQAIHIIQEEMGIAGATAAEAASTIEGSLNMTKAAWANLVTGLAANEGNLSALIDNFVSSASIAASNIMPKVTATLSSIGQLAIGLAPVLASGVSALVGSALPQLINAGAQIIANLLLGLEANAPQLANGLMAAASGLVLAITELVPQFITSGASIIAALATSFANGFPGLVASFVSLVPQFVNAISSAIPLLINAGIALLGALAQALSDPGVMTTICMGGYQIILALVQGLADALPTLIALAPALVSSLVGHIKENSGQIIQIGWEIIATIGKALIDNLPALFMAGCEIVYLIMDAANSVLVELTKLGIEVVEAIIEGISSAWDSLVSWFSGLWGSLFGNLKIGVTASGSGGVDGSHAGGLGYVPFDGYIAELHKGEMVLTATQANAVRAGEFGAGGGEVVAMLGQVLGAIKQMDANMGGNLAHAIEGASLSVNSRDFGRLVKAVT